MTRPPLFMITDDRKRIAAQRAEQIRLDLQGAAVLYAQAIVEEDWKVLNFKSVKAWNEGEFGPNRFSVERRREIHALLTAKGLTVRQIAAATGASKDTVNRDQRKAGVSSETQHTPRQQAAQEREATRKTQRESDVRNRTLGEHEIEEIITANLKRGQIMEKFSVGAHAAQLARNTAVAVREERARAAGQPVNGKSKNPNGYSNTQRKAQLQNIKRTRGISDLGKLALDINKMCTILEDYDIAEYDLDGATDVALLDAASIHDDLVSLGWWLDRSLLSFGRWLDDFDVREKIIKLRNTAGRTPEEAETALRLADRLERKLEAILT